MITKNLNIEEYRQDLNTFFSRLLFLYYADDAEIFEKKNLFLESISNFIEKDGSNLGEFFQKLFDVLNSKIEKIYHIIFQNFHM